MKTNPYHTVTETILQALRSGTPPWVKPWSTIPEVYPCNAISHRPYRGINFLLLSLIGELRGYRSPCWLTYRQAQQVGAHVRKGETATPVILFRVTSPTPDTLIEQEQQENSQPRFYRRFFSVFNLDQIDALPEAMWLPPPQAPAWNACDRAELILKHSGAVIHEYPGNQACYSPQQDWIVLPDRAQFPEATAYYGTALHELVHWTGHVERLDRQLGQRFGLEAYAMEELIAELGSAFLSAHCRLDGALQHAGYLSTWLNVLEQDDQAIFVAAGKAQIASYYLLARAGALEPVSAVTAD